MSRIVSASSNALEISIRNGGDTQEQSELTKEPRVNTAKRGFLRNCRREAALLPTKYMTTYLTTYP
jgi:hypothetical protein